MSEPRTPILVTGGTGRQGGSGYGVADELIRHGWPVRAMVREIDARSDALAALGADVVVGDYTDYRSLLSALEGIERAYFCYPVGSGIAEAAGLFATAGRQQGLKRIVDLSLGSTRPDHPSPGVRAQWSVEKLFEWAGFEGTHLRIAAFFMENLIRVDAPGIRAQSRIANPFGDTPLSWISGRDVGAMAAHLLMDERPTEDRVVTAGGAEGATYPRIAEIASAALDRTIRYARLTPEEWRSAMIAGATAAGLSDTRGIDHLVAQSVAIRSAPPLPVTDHVRRLTGREPISLERFVRSRAEDFAPQPGR